MLIYWGEKMTWKMRKAPSIQTAHGLVKTKIVRPKLRPFKTAIPLGSWRKQGAISAIFGSAWRQSCNGLLAASHARVFVDLRLVPRRRHF
jgi:hypothetical protein